MLIADLVIKAEDRKRAGVATFRPSSQSAEPNRKISIPLGVLEATRCALTVRIMPFGAALREVLIANRLENALHRFPLVVGAFRASAHEILAVRALVRLHWLLCGVLLGEQAGDLTVALQGRNRSEHGR